MSEVDVAAVSRTIRNLLEREGRPVIYADRAAGDAPRAISTSVAAAPDGLLPAFVVAGEAVWREATGKGFELDIVRDPKALLGYRLRGIGAGAFTTVMLATMEATDQVTRPEAIMVNDLHSLWVAANERIAPQPATQIASRRVSPGASP